MFADDTKILGNIRLKFTEEDSQTVQQDLNIISNWCKYWSMYLNGEKCKVIRIGRRTARNHYTIFDPSNGLSHFLETSDSERDLGVIISHDLKPKVKVQKAESKVYAVIALLRNTFVSKDPLLWKKLYATYKRWIRNMPYLLGVPIQSWQTYTGESREKGHSNISKSARSKLP